jgi:hypothetical protein
MGKIKKSGLYMSDFGKGGVSVGRVIADPGGFGVRYMDVLEEGGGSTPGTYRPNL